MNIVDDMLTTQACEEDTQCDEHTPGKGENVVSMRLRGQYTRPSSLVLALVLSMIARAQATRTVSCMQLFIAQCHSRLL